MAENIVAIPHVRKVFYTTYATFPASGITVGDLAYATDLRCLYRWSGASWDAISIYSLAGLAGDIPAAGTLPNGSIYYATDTAIFYIKQGAAWIKSGGLLSSKIIALTRAMNAASGNVAYTGVGFQPRALIVFGTVMDSFGASWGMGDVTLAEMNLRQYNNTPTLDASNRFISFEQSLGVTGQEAFLDTLDADGFTLTWAKIGTPTGTGYAKVLCLG